jgi:F0F1-type ATP synthase membrane subunit a
MNNFAAFELDVDIAAHEVFRVGDFIVTNSFLTGLVGLTITTTVLLYVGIKVKKGSYNRFVGLIQWVFEGLLAQINEVIPDRKLARNITPLAITIFFLILFNYWLSVLPGLDTIRVNGAPILRSPTADLNFVFALAIITVVTVQIYAVKYLGVFGNMGRYFRHPIRDPIGAFEGFLELIGEFSRGASLALRLFGNAFAGEVLLVVIALLSGYFATVALPIFMAFELLIGFIQAYAFFMLTLIFIALAVGHHDNSNSLHHSSRLKPKKAVLQE